MGTWREPGHIERLEIVTTEGHVFRYQRGTPEEHAWFQGKGDGGAWREPQNTLTVDELEQILREGVRF